MPIYTLVSRPSGRAPRVCPSAQTSEQPDDHSKRDQEQEDVTPGHGDHVRTTGMIFVTTILNRRAGVM